jgi:hypothetical protein
MRQRSNHGNQGCKQLQSIVMRLFCIPIVAGFFSHRQFSTVQYRGEDDVSGTIAPARAPSNATKLQHFATGPLLRKRHVGIDCKRLQSKLS